MNKIGFNSKAKPTVKAAAKQQPEETKYTKDALVGSKRFQRRRDLLNVILIDGEEYTIEEVEKAINNYLNKEV